MFDVNQITNFLSPDDCDHIISKFGKNLFEIGTVGGETQQYRIADGNWIYDYNDPIVLDIANRIATLTGFPLENQENPHVVKYEVGGKYLPHHDYFLEDKYVDTTLNRGGQRTYTCIIYLNDDFTGGGTDFPNIKFTNAPVKGSLCYWKNINSSGGLNEDSLHAGLPVESGRKWILIIWIRENKFT